MQVEILDEKDLDFPSDITKAEFKEFIDLFFDLKNDRPGVMMQFNYWFIKHRPKLKMVYWRFEGEVKEDLIEWCRKKFFIWSYNQYKRTLVKEIEEMACKRI